MKTKIFLSALFVALLVTNLNAQKEYYFSKQLDVSYETVLEKLKTALKDENFGVVMESAMHETIMSKIPGVKMDPYIVIGACNAKIALKVLQEEPNIGLLLPCKIVVKYIDENRSEVAVVNPEVSMSVTGNDAIAPMLKEVSDQLKRVLHAL